MRIFCGWCEAASGRSTSQAKWNSLSPNAFRISEVFPVISWHSVLPIPFLLKRPIAKAFANASWQQQERAIENIITLRKHGWRSVDLNLHFDAATQVEKVAVKCLKKAIGCSIIWRKNSPSCGATDFRR
jgi:hypothetical protein